jgi:hypothetical protein
MIPDRTRIRVDDAARDLFVVFVLSNSDSISSYSKGNDSGRCVCTQSRQGVGDPLKPPYM